MSDPDEKSPPLTVPLKDAPGFMTQGARLAAMMLAAGAAGHLGARHPTLAGVFSDAQIWGAAGVALVNAGWSIWGRIKMRRRMVYLAENVDDKVAVVK